MDEVWKIVPSKPGIMASSHGRVWIIPTVGRMPNGSIRAYNTKPTFGVEEKTATARENSPKRRIIRVNKLNKTMKVHRLVCEAFHGQSPFDGAVVMHLDENPQNNRPENLRWGTRKENQNFPMAIAAFKTRTGEKSSWAIHIKRNQP